MHVHHRKIKFIVLFLFSLYITNFNKATSNLFMVKTIRLTSYSWIFSQILLLFWRVYQHWFHIPNCSYKSDKLRNDVSFLQKYTNYSFTCQHSTEL